MDMREAPWSSSSALFQGGVEPPQSKAGFARNENAHFMTIAN